MPVDGRRSPRNDAVMDERPADAGRGPDDPEPDADIALDAPEAIEPGVEPDAEDELDAREAERIRRRDQEAEAEQRALLRPGMGKVFKQIQDAQGKAARDLDTEPPPKKRGHVRGVRSPSDPGGPVR